MTNELKNYINEKYKPASFSVVPGHLPNFKSKAEVDEYFETTEAIMEVFRRVEE